jgi:hypothetical protein
LYSVQYYYVISAPYDVRIILLTCVVPVKQQATNSFTGTPRAHRDYYINYSVRSALAQSTGYSSGSSTQRRDQCTIPTRLRAKSRTGFAFAHRQYPPHHGQNGKAWTTGKPSTSTRRCWTHASMQLPTCPSAQQAQQAQQAHQARCGLGNSMCAN